MMRSKAAVRNPQKVEKKGVVVNFAFGIENCTREQMTALLLKHQVLIPKVLSGMFTRSFG